MEDPDKVIGQSISEEVGYQTDSVVVVVIPDILH